MSIIGKLASSLNRKDEVPNQELAGSITDKNDKNAVQELIENLHNRSKGIQSDCIKVLYEIGERKPALIADYANEFLALLDSKNNRLQWGAMTALSSITTEEPEVIHSSLARIITAANKGSAITKDQCVSILIKLCSMEQFADSAFALLLKQLQSSPTNQLPMYAERARPIISDKNKKRFIKTLTSRLGDIDKDTKRKRVEKIIKQVSEAE